MKRLDSQTSNEFLAVTDVRGKLTAFNSVDDFLTRRAFVITCKKGFWRGRHYHKISTQMILVMSGEIIARITNAETNESEEAALLPGSCYVQKPMIQFEFVSKEEESTLLILCDSLHDPTDYYEIK